VRKCRSASWSGCARRSVLQCHVHSLRLGVDGRDAPRVLVRAYLDELGHAERAMADAAQGNVSMTMTMSIFEVLCPERPEDVVGNVSTRLCLDSM
jgi:hypothetical protein